jgi:hypothetical protein
MKGSRFGAGQLSDRPSGAVNKVDASAHALAARQKALIHKQLAAIAGLGRCPCCSSEVSSVDAARCLRATFFRRGQVSLNILA